MSLWLFHSITGGDSYIEFITVFIKLYGLSSYWVILVWLFIIIKPEVTSKETLTDEGKDIDKQSEQNNVVSNSGDRKSNRVDENSQIAHFEKSKDFEQPKGSETGEYAILLRRSKLHLTNGYKYDEQIELVKFFLAEFSETQSGDLHNCLESEDECEHVV